jgi:hypothetical protein
LGRGEREKGGVGRTPEPVAAILGRVMPAAGPPADAPPAGALSKAPATTGGLARFDFDLAEFPLFRFHKRSACRSGREPLRYADTITGRDGRPVERTWAVHPGPFGFGGQTAQVLLFDLLQLYCEQGARGAHVQFGTLRSLLLRRGERNPSKRDYDRLRRDFDVLRGYDIHCTNAFWDSARRCYADMNWRLFGGVFYFRSGPHPADADQPFGFIEVSSTLRAVARSRGFFSLGFDRRQFYSLRPLEQRLAVYLAKQFASQKRHRRFIPDLARALPVEAGRDRDVRRLLADAAGGLAASGVNLLSDFRLGRSPRGVWVAEFTPARRPPTTYTVPRPTASPLSAETADLVRRITDAVGSADDHLWWTRCVEVLGRGAVDRALGLLKEAKIYSQVRNPGGLLTKFFQDIAKESGASLG